MIKSLNKELLCVNVSVYKNALTRSRRYSILATDNHKRQVYIMGDDKKVRWFPTYCFDQSDRSVPVLKEYHIDDPITSDQKRAIEVTVNLSNGERRWCFFVTPTALADSGYWIGGTKIHFHYGKRHIIIAEKLSEDLIGRMLTYIDSQGELVECTLPL
jgi:hypothetical protein